MDGGGDTVDFIWCGDPDSNDNSCTEVRNSGSPFFVCSCSLLCALLCCPWHARLDFAEDGSLPRVITTTDLSAVYREHQSRGLC